jgi:hypothetical protein
VHTETEPYRAVRGGAGAGAREGLGIVVVAVHEEQLEAGSAQQRGRGAEEAAPFRVARQVAKVAQREERVTAPMHGALDQAAQVASLTVKVSEDE